MRLGEKALDCLRLAAMPIGSEPRVVELFRLADKWSWRALERKIPELVDRGYIDPLKGGIACGGLTAKGAATLSSETHGNTPENNPLAPSGAP